MTRYAKHRNNWKTLLHDDPTLPPYHRRSSPIPRHPFPDFEFPRIRPDTRTQALFPRHIHHHRCRPLHIHRTSELDTRDIRRGNLV